MTVIENGAKTGKMTESNFIPMGTFGLLIRGTHQRKYLQSSGFGPCIGLVMHSRSQNAAVLAHFMSKNAVLDSITAIGSQLESFQLSIKNRNWDFAVFLGGQAKTVKKKVAVTTSSAILDFSSKSKLKEDWDTNPGRATVDGGMDVAIRASSLGNAEERALEIKRHFESMSVPVTYIETGFESCEFALETGVLQLFNETIFGTNNQAALTRGGGKALLFDSTQMN